MAHMFFQRRPDARFGPDQVDEALTWLWKMLEQQPIPQHSAFAEHRDDPIAPKMAYAAQCLRQPADVFYGYTSQHKNYACRALLLCPRPGIRCPG